MKILHYALGFPPYRSGGLTKFCVDLMNQQAEEGHNVALLWPGEMTVFPDATYIKKHGRKGLIDSFEVINPTPVSYDEGIVETKAFMRHGNEAVYRSFLQELQPDVIHIHTLMGMHKALITSAKSLNIRIVFSAHDFFPICPKVTMFRNGKPCEIADSCENCSVCNATALSIIKIGILQSGLYRTFKDAHFVKKLRKQHRDNYLHEAQKCDDSKVFVKNTASDYLQLRDYYKSILEMVDVIHYNSTLTQVVYEKYLKLKHPKTGLIPITHADIQDHRKEKQFDHDLQITYLGPASSAKGYFLLQDALDCLWDDKENGRQDFSLNVYFKPENPRPYMRLHDRYHYDQLGTIFENTDILVTPSIWYETFGYTVLEALSFGVPVVISDTVGAKDIIPEGAGIIVGDITAEKLSRCIMQLNTEQLQNMNGIIVNKLVIPTLASMSESILEKCYL